MLNRGWSERSERNLRNNRYIHKAASEMPYSGCNIVRHLRSRFSRERHYRKLRSLRSLRMRLSMVQPLRGLL